ncbi:hypothetical protein [Brucella sp. 2280]|uniref:hypothetical protein n=1 Tax=Brucella sp. 2280 TaxID=2592625 RepID=UPI001296E325|nr:hypothetical protein [Brucella sp. 2280]QGA56178.1 hypothetical protein GHC20_03350 [Brucella sp. 2280]
MKTALIAGLLALTPTLAFAEAELADWQKSALTTVKREKGIIDAKWRSPQNNMLWVSVQPDGSRRDGLAETICLLLTTTPGAPEGELKTVWIFDPAGYVRGQPSMGETACR